MSGVKGLRKYEKYELLQYTAMLGAAVELGVALKVPAFRTAFPFALLPVTLCAGAAVYLHSKLPKDRKRPLFRWHPVHFFLSLLFLNIMFLLEPHDQSD